MLPTDTRVSTELLLFPRLAEKLSRAPLAEPRLQRDRLSACAGATAAATIPLNRSTVVDSHASAPPVRVDVVRSADGATNTSVLRLLSCKSNLFCGLYPVARRAKSLQIRFPVHQFLIASVRFDVVDDVGQFCAIRTLIRVLAKWLFNPDFVPEPNPACRVVGCSTLLEAFDVGLTGGAPAS
jgi:hypothetical protein